MLDIIAQISQSEVSIPKSTFDENTFQTILQIVFGLAGGIALLIVTLGGLKYIMSQGNAQDTAKAKNTILYALVGLGVSLAAFSIVTFVIDRV